MRRVSDTSAASLHPFVEEAVSPDSVVHTDGWEGYTGLDRKGYRHKVTPLRGRKRPWRCAPRVYRVYRRPPQAVALGYPPRRGES